MTCTIQRMQVGTRLRGVLRIAWSTPGPQDCPGIDSHINEYYGTRNPDHVCKMWAIISVKSLKGRRLSPA